MCNGRCPADYGAMPAGYPLCRRLRKPTKWTWCAAHKATANSPAITATMERLRFMDLPRLCMGQCLSDRQFRRPLGGIEAHDHRSEQHDAQPQPGAER